MILSTEKRESFGAFYLPKAFERGNSVFLILYLENGVTETEDHFLNPSHQVSKCGQAFNNIVKSASKTLLKSLMCMVQSSTFLQSSHEGPAFLLNC